MTNVHEQTLLETLRNLLQERVSVVEDFVDFLTHRLADERGLTQAAGQLATAALPSLGQPRRCRRRPAMSSRTSSSSRSPLPTNPPRSVALLLQSAARPIHRQRPDLIVMAVTSQPFTPDAMGEVSVWTSQALVDTVTPVSTRLQTPPD